MMLIVLGVLVTLCNNWMSYSFHSYQSELFPTRIRSRAVGFVYSWSRLSAALSGLAVALLLNFGGVIAVFGFIAFSMLIVVISIGGFGPRTADWRWRRSPGREGRYRVTSRPAPSITSSQSSTSRLLGAISRCCTPTASYAATRSRSSP